MTDISSITNTTSTSSTSSSSSSASINGDKEAFLKLLTTQLENQNPLDPVDTTEFTNQLISYSTLEQLMNVNTKLDSLIEAQSSAAAA